MKITGLQKMTLLDYPGKVACTVFLGGCNFRCPFCHNFELLDAGAPAVMEEEALLAFLEKRKGLLDGVCVTGGEPTLHPQLPAFLEKIKALGYAVKLDTNGYRPQVLQALVGRGLVDYVAMDIKNSPQRYARTAGLSQLRLESIEQSIRLLLEGKVEYEFRTTVVEPLHDADSFIGIRDWLRALSPNRAGRCFLQPFTDRDSVPFDGLKTPGRAELEAYRRILEGCADEVRIRGMD